MTEAGADPHWSAMFARLEPEAAQALVNLLTLACGQTALAVRQVLDHEADVRSVLRALMQATAALRRLEQVLSDNTDGAALAATDVEPMPLPVPADPATGPPGVLHLLTPEQRAMLLAHLREAVQHCRIVTATVAADERLQVIRLHIGAAAAALTDAGRLLCAHDNGEA